MNILPSINFQKQGRIYNFELTFRLLKLCLLCKFDLNFSLCYNCVHFTNCNVYFPYHILFTNIYIFTLHLTLKTTQILFRKIVSKQT